VRNLRNAAAYTFSVVAINRIGAGPTSPSTDDVAPAPVISVGDASVVEGDSGTRTISFPVTLSRASSVPLTVGYTLQGDTASLAAKPGGGVDGKIGTGTLKFTPSGKGETGTIAYVDATIYADVATELDETFSIVLSQPVGGFALGRDRAVGTILNDDQGAGLRVGISDTSIVEGDAGLRSAQVKVTLSDVPGTAVVTVPYTVAGIGADWGKSEARGNDFGGLASGTLNFTGGATSATLSVPIYGDVRPEGDEAVEVTLGAITGAEATRSVGTVTIIDDDGEGPAAAAASTVSVGDALVVEGDFGTRIVTFPVTLSQAATAPVVVNYRIVGGSATGALKPAAGVDVKTGSGKLTFTAVTGGESRTVLYVNATIYSDTTPEADETFALELTGVTGGYSLGRDRATGTIDDEDEASGLRVGIGDATVVEGNAGTRIVQVKLTISAAPGTAVVSIPWSIAGVGADWGSTSAAGNDFGGVLSGVVTFTGAATSRTLSIPIYGESRQELDEYVWVTLGAVTGATVSRSTGVITIVNDD